MSLKMISIGALARGMAATSVLAATLIPTVVSAETQAPAQQAASLAGIVAQAALAQATPNTSPATVQSNAKMAIADAIDGWDPQIALAALQLARTQVATTLPTTSLSVPVQQSVLAAFATVNGIVLASLNAGNGVGAVGAHNFSRSPSAPSPLSTAPLVGGGGRGGGSHRF